MRSGPYVCRVLAAGRMRSGPYLTAALELTSYLLDTPLPPPGEAEGFLKGEGMARMKVTPVRLVLLAATLALAIAAAGCGGGGEEGATTQPAETGGETQAPPTETTAAPSGGTLVFGTAADPVVLDPALISDGESYRVNLQIYEGLIRTKPGTTELEPLLAESWTSNADGTEWTFALRQGVTFHDGTPFNADAVCANFERWYNFTGSFQNPSASYYWQYAFGGGFANPAEGSPGPEDSLYKGCVVVDDATVTLQLNKPEAVATTAAPKSFLVRLVEAQEAERASIKYKQVEYMSSRIGEVYNGVITGVTDFGLFVEEKETKCEGLVRLKDLTDDFYLLNEKEMMIVGRKHKKIYRVGDKVKIKVATANMNKKVIDYVFVK